MIRDANLTNIINLLTLICTLNDNKFVQTVKQALVVIDRFFTPLKKTNWATGYGIKK